MLRSASVMYAGKTVGTVMIQKNGLYYSFICRCSLPLNKMYTLWAEWEEHREKLGLLIPEQEKFTLRTQMAIKCFPEETVRFCIYERGRENATDFYPVTAEEPFAELERLPNARFYVKDGIWGVYFTP